MLTNCIIKGYEFGEQIGTGGFGVVYRAHQSVVGRDVAIKVILPQYANDPDFIRRFEGEAQLIARLEHPFIVPLYDYWREPGGAYLVMRWLHESLRDRLLRGHLALGEAARLIDQIASALATAHRNHVIHRDLKPANILRDDEGNGYLADFGIAKIIGQPTGETGQGQMIGSPAYITPEQIKSEPVTPQTDLYSLGVVLFEILTGTLPFPDATTVTALIYKHLNEPLPSVKTHRPDLPLAVDTVIQTATAKDPAQRYSDALRMAAAFKALMDAPHRLAAQPLVEPLTERELEIVGLMVEGLGNAQIAERLTLSPGTVKWYVKQIYAKLDVHTREQAVQRVNDLQLLSRGLSSSLVQSALVEGEETVTPSRAVPILPPQNPYKGLRAFEQADTADFFGRQSLTDQLLARLAEDDVYSRFLAVVGPSGCGKSSVVKAGMIPALRAGRLPGSERWFVAEMVPGAHPFEEVELALLRIAATPVPSLLPQLREDARGLLRAVRRVLPEQATLLLVIDQFEEVFTLVQEAAERESFLDCLTAAVTDPRSPLRVVITLRADFVDRPLWYPDFGDLLRRRIEFVLPMTATELNQAITAPAQRVGVQIAPELLAALVKDVHDEPGILPLLQYTLTEMFERHKGAMLALADYQSVGGVFGALAKRADDVYTRLDGRAQQIAQQVFLRLVTLGEGIEETRRRARHSELLSVAGGVSGSQSGMAILQTSLDAFGSARLLTFDRDPITREPTVEVAHEALLREWKRLRTWLNDSRGDVRLQRLLATTAAEWLQANCDSSYLLTGSRLAQFEGWSATTGITLTQDEQAYLETSVTEQKLRAARQRRARNAILLVAIVAAVVMSILTLIAFDREAKAEREAAVNHSLVLANSAQEANTGGRTELGLLLALEAVKITDAPVEAERALRTVGLGAGSQALFEGHTSPVQTVAFSSNSHIAVSGSCGQVDGKTCRAGELILWDIQSKTKLRQLAGHTDVVKGVAFTADSRNLWSASRDGTILLWDVDPTSSTFGTSIRSFAPHLGSVNAIALNPDGSALLAGTGDGSVILLNTQTGEVIRRFTGHTGGVNSVAFSPDSQTILSGGNDSTLRLWKLSTGEMLQRFDGHTNAVVRVAFKGDGKAVLSCSADLTMRLWDVATGKELHRFTNGTSINAMVITPDSRMALVDYGGGLLVLFDLDDWRITSYLTANPSGQDLSTAHAVTTAAFDSSGKLALTGAQGGNVILWTMAVDRQVRRFADDKVADGFAVLAVRPDGRRMVTGTMNTGEALYWDIDPGSPTNGTVRARLGGYLGAMVSVAAFSPDGRSAVIGSADWLGDSGAKKLILWNLDETSSDFGKPIYTLTGITYYPRSAAFTLDGRKVLVGTENLQGAGELAVWEVATGTLHHIDTGRDVSAILMTPDGRHALTASAYFKDIVELDIDLTSSGFGKDIRHIPTRTFTFDLKWGPDGTTLFVAENDIGLAERDYPTGTIIRQFQGRGSGGLWTIALSPDKRYVATGDADGIALWDYKSGGELWYSSRQESFVFNVAFSPDSQMVFSQALPGQPVEWRVSEPSLGDLLAWIPRNRFLRELTCAERKQYRVEPLCEDGK